MKNFLAFLARICLSLLFIISAAYKIFDWQEMEKAFIRTICEWHGYLSGAEALQQCFTDVLPWVPLVLVVAVTMELLGGLSIFFNIHARIGAFLLILFLIPTTVIFHQFWYVDGSKRDLQLVFFLKNLSILGGLFYTLAYGGKNTKSPARMPEKTNSEK